MHSLFRRIGLFSLTVCLSTLVFESCVGSEKVVTAEGLLNSARRLEKKDPQAALLALDSVHEEFPRDIKSRREADTIEWRIELAQAERSLPYIDSVLAVDTARLNVLSVNFNHSPASEYQDLGSWEHRVFRTENNTGRNYLKPTVSDHGDLVVMSFYVGRETLHTSLTVSINGLDRNSETADDVYSFNDGEVFHEFLTFNDPVENGLSSFVANTEGEEVKVTLKGESELTYVMPQRDRQAFKETLELAVLLKEIRDLTIQQVKFTRQIELLSKRINLIEYD